VRESQSWLSNVNEDRRKRGNLGAFGAQLVWTQDADGVSERVIQDNFQFILKLKNLAQYLGSNRSSMDISYSSGFQFVQVETEPYIQVLEWI
jgi:hypothetical protein